MRMDLSSKWDNSISDPKGQVSGVYWFYSMGMGIKSMVEDRVASFDEDDFTPFLIFDHLEEEDIIFHDQHHGVVIDAE